VAFLDPLQAVASSTDALEGRLRVPKPADGELTRTPSRASSEDIRMHKSYTLVAALFAIVGALASVGVGLRVFDSGLAEPAPVAASPSRVLASSSPAVVSPSPVSPELKETKAHSRSLTISEATSVQNVKDLLYYNYGYVLQQSDRHIAVSGRAACRMLGPNPTRAEIMFDSRITSRVLHVPRRLGFVVLATLYWAFC
jgi:hypothetical protein